jgi:hypothetical protein
MRGAVFATFLSAPLMGSKTQNEQNQWLFPLKIPIRPHIKFQLTPIYLYKFTPLGGLTYH